jgi:hypothetical protein
MSILGTGEISLTFMKTGFKTGTEVKKFKRAGNFASI